VGKPPPTELIAPISDERRREILWQTLATAPEPSCIRVFAYGSLIWSPCFDVVEQQRATLHDFHRGFSIWSVIARGTPEQPGLGFALEEKQGGVCVGVVFTLPEGTGEEELWPLWEREMWTDTYTPTWVKVDADGSDLSALTFVVSPDHFQYAGDLAPEEKAKYIVKASGRYGTCYDYLADTVMALRGQGFQDPDMEELFTAVQALRN